MELTCRSAQDRSYQVILEWNAVDRLLEIFHARKITGPFFVISDRQVFKHQGKRLLAALRGADVNIHLVSPGEPSKSLQNWNRIQNWFLEKGADRRAVVIAFGGGVVGDLAGFSASTFMRGLDLIQVPTTMLSQSDSSIGAKVAVNHPRAKNLIGSFYQPSLVITDPSLLSTLPKREFAAGLGEAIKYGVIADPKMFDLLYEDIENVLTFNRNLLTDLIARCIRIKIQVVEEDERENGLRKILNFGHTIGHALEQATRYKRLRHGEAVAWGMLAAGHIAIERGMWYQDEFVRLESILFRSGCLYRLGPLRVTQVLEALKHDKKKTGKTLNFILPERTGKVVVVKDVTREQIVSGLRFIFDINKRRRVATV